MISPDENTAIFPHIIVIAEPGSKATIVETYASTTNSFTNAAVQIFVADNANITHYRVQKDAPEAFNYGVTEVSLGRGSVYDSTNINLGSGISRHDIDLKFRAEGGEAWIEFGARGGSLSQVLSREGRRAGLGRFTGKA